jgi:hypothetical protein
MIFTLGLISCKEKEPSTNSHSIEKQSYTDLKKTKEIEFGGGDVWGTTYIFNNFDSSVVKVLVVYDAGDYGKGQNEYLVVDNKLTYQRDSIVDWVINKSPLDSSNYKLRETISYFNSDSTGTKISKAVYSMTFDFSDEKKEKLRTQTADSVNLTKMDYIKLMEELKEALERTVIVE